MSKHSYLTENLANPLNDYRSSSEVDLLDLAIVATRRLKLIFVIVGCVAFVTIVALLLLPNKYTSVATILPSGQVDKMADLKALAGLGGLLGSGENSSDLFPTILQSRTVLESVLGRSYTFDDNGKSVSIKLADYLEKDNPDRLRDALKGITAISTDKKTGVITVAVETKYPGLSQAIVAAYLAGLEDFNLHNRRSQAKDNVAYLSRQLESAHSELTSAEDSLESLQRINRNWSQTDNPDLIKLLARTQRSVEIENRKFLFLTQEYESAKLEMQKDVPIVRTLDLPSLPTRKSGPQRLMILMLLTVLTFGATLFGVLFFELMTRRRTASDDPALKLLRRELRQAFSRSPHEPPDREEAPKDLSVM